jgi:hypothetical protein
VTCINSICMPMNFHIIFPESVKNMLVTFDFPVNNFEDILSSIKVQIFTTAQKIYDMNISSISVINDTTFNVSFNLTTTVYSNDTLTVYIDDNLYNARQGVSYPIVQFSTNPPYTFVCLTKCRTDAQKYTPKIFPIVFLLTFLCLLVSKAVTGIPLSRILIR